MAIISKKTRTFSDLDLSLTQNPINGDIAIIYDDVAIKRSLKTLIFMNAFDYPFHPEISSAVNTLLFNNYTPDMGSVLRRLLINLINNHEPRVQLIDIMVSPSPQDHDISITIYFKIVNNPEPLTFTVLLQRLR